MVAIFKTNISSKKKIKKVRPVPNKIDFIHKCNFDLEDCDNILRIESEHILAIVIIEKIKQLGFECLELE